MLKKLGKIFGIILNILIIIIVVIGCYSLVQTKIFKYDYADFFGYTIFEVATGSMSGSIEVGDIIIVKILDNYDELKVDDIVTYKEDNNIITHRIIEIDEDTVITKGDANNTEDKPIEEKAIIGNVIKIIHDVGIWKKVILTPEVYMSIIMTLILFGIAISCYKLDDKGIENDKRKEEEDNERRKND